MINVLVADRGPRTVRHLRGAMRRQRPVTIEYVTASGRQVLRTIEPYALATSKSGQRYVRAMDRESGEVRSWRIDRINSYTVSGGRSRFLVERPAERPEPATLTWDAHYASEMAEAWACEGQTLAARPDAWDVSLWSLAAAEPHRPTPEGIGF